MTAIVVLIEHALLDHDVERLAHFYDPDPVTIHIVAAASAEGGAITRAVDETMAARSIPEDGDPEAAVGTSIKALRAAGVATVDGELAGPDTVQSVLDAADTVDADQIWVITPMHWLEDSLHRDWAHHLRAKGRWPVLRVISGTDQIIN